MVKALSDLKTLCDELGLAVPPQTRPAKEPYIFALREALWAREHSNEPLPEQVGPMLLGDWADLAVVGRSRLSRFCDQFRGVVRQHGPINRFAWRRRGNLFERNAQFPVSKCPNPAGVLFAPHFLGDFGDR